MRRSPTHAVAGLALALIALLQPVGAPARTWTMKRVICPLDGTEFFVEQDLSGTVNDQRLDGRQLGYLTDPPIIPVCPKDGFVVVRPNMSDELVEELGRFVRRDAYQEFRKKEASYFLLALFLRVLHAPPHIVAMTYVRAAWQVEDMERPRVEQEVYYLILAQEQLDRHLEASPQDLEMTLLAVEIDRRLGLFDAAKARLSAARNLLGPRDGQHARVIEIQRELIRRQDRDPHALSEFGP